MADLGSIGQGGVFSSGAWSPNSSTDYPEPFTDMASLAMPQTMSLALRWCEYLTFANGTYFRAMDRTLSYFITDIELSNIEDDREKEKIDDYLHDTNGVDLLDEIHTAGLNYMVYGNDFSSVLMPFRRSLSCPNCHLELPLKQVATIPDFKFKWADFKFNAYCPKCKITSDWKHIDRRAGDSEPVTIKHWSPHEIELLWDPYFDSVDFIWKIPEDYRRMIKEGKLYHLERAPWEVIDCVKNDKHLRFDKDVIYHMKENTLAGVRNRGWGISRMLSNFRQAWYVQVLHRYNEAIALDYVIPFRVITPAPGPGGTDQARDVLLNLNAGGYMSQIQRMLRQRRRDPATWHTLPFPVQYQALGGDATQLAPSELMAQGIEVLLNNIGVPVELFKGNLSVQAAPPALRLYESSWSHLTHNLNGFISFIMKRLQQLLNWEKATARLQKVTHADDAQRQMAALQLMMGGQLSKQTGLKAIGANYFDEVRRQTDESEFEAEQQNKMTEDLEQSAMMNQMAQGQQQMADGGAPTQGGMQPPQGGAMPPGSAGAIASQPTVAGKPTTPEELQAKAQTLAQQVLQMPESQKKSELIALKKSDPVLHSLVTAEINNIRQQARTAGGNQLIAQQFGKQGNSNSVLGREYLD